MPSSTRGDRGISRIAKCCGAPETWSKIFAAFTHCWTTARQALSFSAVNKVGVFEPVDAPPRPLPRMIRRILRTVRYDRFGLVAGTIYVALSAIIFGRALAQGLSAIYIGRSNDPSAYM